MKNTYILKRTLCALTLTVLWLGSFAQSVELRGKDTVAVIPIADLRKANVRLVELQECKEEADSLFSQTRTLKGLTNNQRSTIDDLKNAIKLDAVLIADKQKIADLCDLELKKKGRQMRFLKIQRAGLIGVVAVLALKIVLTNK